MLSDPGADKWPSGHGVQGVKSVVLLNTNEQVTSIFYFGWLIVKEVGVRVNNSISSYLKISSVHETVMPYLHKTSFCYLDRSDVFARKEFSYGKNLNLYF